MSILTVLGTIALAIFIVLMIIGIVFAGVLLIGLTASMLKDDNRRKDRHD